MSDYDITINVHGATNHHFQHRRYLPISFINQAALNVLGQSEQSCYHDENDGFRKIDIEVTICGFSAMLTFRVLTSIGPVQQSEMKLPICVIGRDNRDTIDRSINLALAFYNPAGTSESDLHQS